MVQSAPKADHALKTSLFRIRDENISTRRKKVMVVPAANVDETNDEYIVTIASPGFKREHLRVLICNNIITIAAEKEPSQKSCLHDRCEYDYHRWKRDFLLPDDADALLTRARYLDGELIIRIPRGIQDNLPGIINIYVY